MSTWPFVPQVTVRERMQWQTEIIRCKAAEQRLRLRNAPRTELEYDYQLVDGEVEAATTLSRELGDSEIDVPFWHELAQVGPVAAAAETIALDTTIARYKVGSGVFLMDADGHFETHTVLGITDTELTIASPGIGTTFANSVVMPIYPCYFKGPFKFNKGRGEYVTGEAEFVLSEDFEITGDVPGRYWEYLPDGSPIMIDRPIVTGKIPETHLREVDKFGNIAGPITYAPKYASPTSMTAVTWSFDTREALWEFRLWLYTLYGKQKSFWMPRWTHDFIPASDVNTQDYYIDVYENPMLLDTYTGLVFIISKTGQVAIETCDEWTDLGGGIWRMGFPTNVGKSMNEVELICRVSKYRFNSDNIEFNYKAGGVVDVRLPVIEVPE